MPDISMCGNTECRLARDCYRSPESGTKPSERRQSWSAFTPYQTDEGVQLCDYYWPTGGSDADAKR